jgi:putative ABC transport system substrate-binding protein
MHRRQAFRVFAAGALIAATRAALGQAPAKVPRVALLLFAAPESYVGWPGIELFRQRLRELGYVDGKNILIEERYAGGDASRLPSLAREIVASKVDIIVSPTVGASIAAHQATSTIPIVMVHAGDPIRNGLIASLAHPGGNVTGTTNMLLGGKQVELLRELVPRLGRLGVLVNPMNAGSRVVLANMTDTARSLGIELVVAQVTSADDVSKALAMFRGARLEGLTMMVEKVVVESRVQLLEFATSARLPASYDAADLVRQGGLISYGPVLDEDYAFAAVYVDKILKGAKPADLPVQQPTKYELAINLKTARALGLTVPPSLLARATEVI